MLDGSQLLWSLPLEFGNLDTKTLFTFKNKILVEISKLYVVFAKKTP
jgi:hypothetical protein